MDHRHICYCGGVENDHETGVPGCFRRMSEDNISCVNSDTDMWQVNNETITGYILKDQRGFFQHPCGCWSRYSGTTHSLETC